MVREADIKFHFEKWEGIELTPKTVGEYLRRMANQGLTLLHTGDTIISRAGSNFYICKVQRVARLLSPQELRSRLESTPCECGGDPRCGCRWQEEP